MGNLLRKKNIAQIRQDNTDEGKGGHELRKILGVKDLTFMGIGALVGAGIFSTIGDAVYQGGPGVVFLFIISAITCGLTALCYAEFASRIPVSGSAYTYSYVTFGELIAWIIGWALILEYAIGNIVLAISWSGYFDNILQGIGIHLPRWMVVDPQTAQNMYKVALAGGKPTSDLAWLTAPTLLGKKIIFNLPAFAVVIFITWLTYIGIKESKKGTNLMVYVKLAILFLIVIIGLTYINTDNYTPFFPNGFSGVLKGVSAVFFAYIGFDAISTTAEECKNPQRDLPRGMGYSLLICTIIYVIVTLVITGMVNYKEFNHVKDPLAFVFDYIDQKFIGQIISFSAVIAAMSVLLVFQIGQPRIWLSMSRDGLLPEKFSRIHPKYKTPSFATIITGILVGVPSLFMEAGLVVDLTSIGTLFAFLLVCGGILALPKDEPQAQKKYFKVPYINGKWIIPFIYILFIYFFRERVERVLSLNFQDFQDGIYLVFLAALTLTVFLTFRKNYSLIPILGAIFCLYLMTEIPVRSWIAFFFWMGIGLIIYFSYGYRNSLLKNNFKE